MIIGISGKIGSGKDTVGRIIQYLTLDGDSDIKQNRTIQEFLVLSNQCMYSPNNSAVKWEIKKFAGKVKLIVSLLTGIPVKDLEKAEVKNSKLPDEWIRYGYADGFFRDMHGEPTMINKQCSKERYEEELETNWPTAYKTHLTYRELLQFVGTNLFRDKFHEDTWVNALFADYKGTVNPNKIDWGSQVHANETIHSSLIFPNWLITDVRFPNELKAVKDRDGIVIRVNGDWDYSFKGTLQDFATLNKDDHPSETALDNYDFDYTIDNNGTIEDLIIKVKIVLQDMKLL